jgi:hypothetical protein
LSVRQAYAWAILHAGKDIENRTWSTDYRGPVLVHAGWEWHEHRGAPFRERYGIGHPAELPRGGIVGVVEILDCVTAHASRWFMGPWGFVLRGARTLPLHPCRGRLGIFEVPFELTDIESKVETGELEATFRTGQA